MRNGLGPPVVTVDTMTSPILITGCSSGLGHAAALQLVDRGHTVYATARNPDSLGALADAGAHTLALDVTDDDSMRAAVAAVEEAHGAVGTLINNAGYAQAGPVETVGMDDARRQFETNVFGLMRMSQLVLPAMRDAGRGRIINVSSMAGRMVLPAAGWYHSSKYAVEALSDAMRVEVKPFGVKVVLIEPGAIKTEFDATAGAHATVDPNSPYSALETNHAAMYTRAYGSAAASSARAAKKYVKAVEARWPRHRYAGPGGALPAIYTRQLLGSRFWDWGTGRAYGWR